MSLFVIPEHEVLRVGGKGRTRTGKTTFFASNAIAPIYAIDSDKGFVRARNAMNKRFPELSGKVITPTKRGCIEPFHIDLEARQNIIEHDIETTAVDSVSKIYSLNATPAVMAGRMSTAERERYGFSKNKASNLMDKAFAIRTLASLAAYGTHIFYIWHEKQTVDMKNSSGGQMKTIMAESMSGEERQRLMESIDIVLSFRFEKGKYAIHVEDETRGYGYEPNTGFTIYDTPGNYWRNTMPRLYNLIYTTFSGKDEAVSWGMQALKKEDPVEMEAFYDEIHSRANPQNHSAMWVAWMLAIEEKYNNGKQAKLAKKEEEPVIVKNESGKKEPEKPATPPEIEPEKKEEPEPEPVPAEVEKNGSASPLEYSNGDPVELDDVTDYEIYLHRFTYAPENKDYMLRAKEMSGEDWKQE
jgi:hypothetical protein